MAEEFVPRSMSVTMFENKSDKAGAPIMKGNACISIAEILELPTVMALVKKDGVDVEVECVEVDIALWSKVSKTGTKFWSGTMKKKWVKEAESANYSFPHGADSPGTDHSQYSDGSEFTQPGYSDPYAQTTPPPLAEGNDQLPF